MGIPVGPGLRLAIGLCLVLVVGLGLAPGFVLDAAQGAAEAQAAAPMLTPAEDADVVVVVLR